MQKEAGMQDLFPEPNLFSMERDDAWRYRRERYVRSGSRRCCGPQRAWRGIQPSIIVALGFVALLVMVFGITAANAKLSSGTENAIWAGADPSEDIPDDGADHSTPMSEWKRGSVPMLYQTDPAWAGRSYGEGTMETHGCGPTCLSMVYVALTGRTNLDPKAMADFSTRCGYLEEGVTTWALMTEGAAQLGLQSREIAGDGGSVKEALATGSLLILSMGQGDFTTDGHFIVVCGTDGSGNLIVRDPNSAERSQRAWEPVRVLSQCRNIWAFSV